MTLFVLALTSSVMAASISGNDYVKLSEREKGWYFLGVLDAIKQSRDVYSKSTDLSQSEFEQVWESCISGRPVHQHLAIVDLWLKNNPTRWQEPAIQLIFDAERESCGELESD